MKTFSSFPRVGIVVIFLSVSIILAGCKQVQQKAQEVAQQVQTGLLTEKDLAGITDSLVRKHLVAQANVRAYRILSRSSGRGEPLTTTEIQILGTEVRFRTITQIGNKTTQEMIVIGDTTYVMDFKDGKWWKQTTKSETKEEVKGLEIPNLEDIKAEFTKKQQVAQFKQLGTEACGSLTCYKYQEIDNDNKEEVRTFWFDNQDFLLRKEVNKFGEFISTNEYSYDSININVPSPTKDVPAGKSIFEMMVG